MLIEAPKVSICIATFNKPASFTKVLESIYKQHVPFKFEVIVIDDGSETSYVEHLAKQYPIVWHKINREAKYRNPAIARNMAYKAATGEVIIAQSDDVVHKSACAIEILYTLLQPGTFVIATVINTTMEGRPCIQDGEGYGNKLIHYTGLGHKRPLFFLGSLYRKDLYAIGGNDEEFIYPSREDVWFGLCLIEGLKLKPHYTNCVIGHHLTHQHCTDWNSIQLSRELFTKKYSAAIKGEIPWCASGGPWKY